jgi:hypothetical protein
LSVVRLTCYPWQTQLKESERKNNIECYIEHNEKIDRQVNAERVAAFKAGKTPFLVEIEPKNLPSLMDGRVRVSEFRWAVTMICYGGLSDNHARLCIEGIKDGLYFCKIAHFDGFIVRNKPVNNTREIQLVARSDVWIRSREEVQNMLEIIDHEATNFIHLPYSYLGKNALFSLPFGYSGGKPNCLDWAAEKLALANIVLQRIFTDNFVAAARLYTKDPLLYDDKPVAVSI